MIVDWFYHEYLQHLIESLVDPKKRVSFGYLIFAAMIGLAWSAFMSRHSWRYGLSQGIRKLFGKRVLFSQSASADYKLLLLNHGFLLLVAPFFLSKVALTTSLFFLLHEVLPSGSAYFSSMPFWTVSVIYTLFLFVLDDFSRYVVHAALHRIPFLWAFHKIHHTAETLSPLTVYRTHPIEAVVFSFRSIIVQASCIALFVFIFGEKVDLVTIYGVNVLLFVFNLSGSNLRHSHIPISYGRILERIFISPAQHQIHHSIMRCHHGKNFGAALSVWDYLFGSLHLSEKNTHLTFGIKNRSKRGSHNLFTLYVQPFVEASREVKILFRKLEEIKKDIINVT